MSSTQSDFPDLTKGAPGVGKVNATEAAAPEEPVEEPLHDLGPVTTNVDEAEMIICRLDGSGERKIKAVDFGEWGTRDGEHYIVKYTSLVAAHHTSFI